MRYFGMKRRKLDSDLSYVLFVFVCDSGWTDKRIKLLPSKAAELCEEKQNGVATLTDLRWRAIDRDGRILRTSQRPHRDAAQRLCQSEEFGLHLTSLSV